MRRQIDLEAVLRDAWLGIPNSDKIVIPNPLEHMWNSSSEEPLMLLTDYMTKSENFGFVCEQILNVHPLPYQLMFLQELWNHKYPMFIGARGAGKSWLLAVYCMIRALLKIDTKTVVVGAGFRQSKVIYEYCEKIWNNAPVLRSMCKGINQGPTGGNDRCIMRICDSQVIFLPMGTGDKIRGQRASCLIADEFASIQPDIFETVVVGFAATAANPYENVKEAARRRKLKELNLRQEFEGLDENQIIMSGTCDFDYQHFARYWKRYKTIIQSRGDRDKLKEVFGEEVPDNFNYRDYTIIRFPYELIPEGFLDDTTISRARATLNTANYAREYSCLGPDTYIITDRGCSKIIDVKVGDRVLTHRGRFRKVTELTQRKVDSVLSLKTYGYNQSIDITANHPIWMGDEKWQDIQDASSIYSANLQESNGKISIQLSDYVDNFVLDNGRIWPRLSGSKYVHLYEYVNSQRELKTAPELSLELNIPVQSVYRIWYHKNNWQKTLPNSIPLNYHFGLILGYYAAEGSIGAGGRQVNFALDGHINATLQSFVDKLSHAIYQVFGFWPKVYHKDNVASVSINRRLIADLLAKIVPGISTNKYVDPEVLYSNSDLMRGFIEGYWDGDGHWTKSLKFCSSSSTSIALSTQIKTCLSYFSISASLNIKQNITSNFRGKLHHCNNQYGLTIHGADSNKFKQLFYHASPAKERISKYVINDGIKSQQTIINKESHPYNGYVYNLEVEEDHSYSLLNMTVHNCVFPRDSEGFFRRSLVDSCVTNPQRPFIFPISGPVSFSSMLVGDPSKRYVMGIDPASETDNFAISIVELNEDHVKVVYCWTINREKHQQARQNNHKLDNNYYIFCANKIRDLMRRFNIVRIAIDSQGGGYSVEEALRQTTEDVVAIYRIEDPDKPQDTDHLPGLHIIEMVNFASAEWVSSANHGMRKDFETRFLIFPYFDSLSLELANIGGDTTGGAYGDNQENCIFEIEELKDELTTIVQTQTDVSGRERFSTPEIKLAGNKKGRLRKDRYSALLMANMAARTILAPQLNPIHKAGGGFARNIRGAVDHNAAMYSSAPEWFAKGMKDCVRYLGRSR